MTVNTRRHQQRDCSACTTDCKANRWSERPLLEIREYVARYLQSAAQSHRRARSSRHRLVWLASRATI